MATEIIMPKNGMDMQEGILIRWLVKVGDKVEKDDPIMEIETDKVTMESEAPAGGTVLALYYDEGVTIPVLKILGYIGEEGEQVPDAPPEALEEQTGQEGQELLIVQEVMQVQEEEAPAVQEGEVQEEPETHELQEAEEAKESQVSQDGQGIQESQEGQTIPGIEASAAGEYEYDVAVIGGGPAGYVAAIKAAQLGGRTALFEKDRLGGTCLNRGCIPTKTYIKTAEYLEHIRRAPERGIINDINATVDMARVVAYKNAVVSKLTDGVAYLLRSSGVDVVIGEAEAKNPHEVECGGRAYTAKALILCGGSKPGMPPIPGIGHMAVLTSDEILDMSILPNDLVILGGGVIGCEIACAFKAFGTNVTILEMLPDLVSNMGRKVADAIRRSLEAAGVKVYTDIMVTAIEDDGGKPVVIAGETRMKTDVVLAATGRDADLTCFGALTKRVATKHGKVVVNDKTETNIPGVYAAGDVTGGQMLAHTAFNMAETAAVNALGGRAYYKAGAVPAGLYTIPEAAAVGLDEEEAREKAGDRLTVGYFPLSANGRALASGEPEGFVQVMVDKEFGEILGVRIVGADAVEMITEPAAMMAIEATAHDIADGIIHAHPTYAEAFMEACADALGKAIHLPKK